MQHAIKKLQTRAVNHTGRHAEKGSLIHNPELSPINFCWNRERLGLGHEVVARPLVLKETNTNHFVLFSSWTAWYTLKHTRARTHARTRTLTHTHTHSHTYTHTHTHTHTLTHIHTLTHSHTCTHARTHAHTHTHTQSSPPSALAYFQEVKLSYYNQKKADWDRCEYQYQWIYGQWSAINIFVTVSCVTRVRLVQPLISEFCCCCCFLFCFVFCFCFSVQTSLKHVEL